MSDSLFQRRGEERGDARMIATAIARGWEIPEDMYHLLPIRVIALLQSKSDRDRLAAAKLLLLMNKQNMELQPKELTINHRVDNATNNNPKERLFSLIEQIENREVIDVTPKDATNLPPE